MQTSGRTETVRGRSVRPGALLAGLTATPQAVLMFLCVLRTGKALVDLSAGPYSGILLFVLWVFAFGNAVLVWIYIVCTAFLCAVVVYATGLDAAAGLTPDRDYVRWLPAEALFTAVNAVTAAIAFCLPSALELAPPLFFALGYLTLAAIVLRALSAIRFLFAALVRRRRGRRAG